MTYRELLYKAQKLINHNEITLGEYDEMTKPLDREIEERKQGEWIRNPSVNGFIDDFRCSYCNSNPPVMSVNISWGWNLTNFCPNCGADMREE